MCKRGVLVLHEHFRSDCRAFEPAKGQFNDLCIALESVALPGSLVKCRFFDRWDALDGAHRGESKLMLLITSCHC